MKKRMLLCLAILVYAALFAGCWDSRELDTLAIVTGIGIDASEKAGKANYVLQVGKVRPIAGDTAPEDSKDGNAYILKEESDSILEAINLMQCESSRILFLHHTQALLFGEEIARQGILPQIDFFLRDQEIRMEVRILVIEGKAEDVLKAKFRQEVSPSVAIARMMNNNESVSEYLETSLLNFALRLHDDTMAQVLPLARLNEEDGESWLETVGLVVLKGGRVVGRLDGKLTNGYILSRGKIKAGSITVATDKGRATLNILHSDSCAKPIVGDDGEIVLRQKIEATMSLGELKGFSDMTIDEIMNHLRGEAEKEMVAQVQNCFVAGQAMNADLFGVGSLIKKKMPQRWETLKVRWDTLYPRARLDVEATAELVDTGQSTNILRKGDRK